MEVDQLLVCCKKFEAGARIDQLQTSDLADVVVLQQQVIGLYHVLGGSEDRGRLEL